MKHEMPETKQYILDVYVLKNAIRLVIGGYLFDNDGGGLEDIPVILKEMEEEYTKLIKQHTPTP